MPLIQWIMQNLGKNYRIQGSGGIVIYGDAAKDARYTEYLFSIPVKFAIGATGFDLNGYPWTITSIHVASNDEVTYFAKTGNRTNSFKDRKIQVNQLPVYPNFIDLNKIPVQNLPVYENKYQIMQQEAQKHCLERLDTLAYCLDRPLENLPTYSGKAIIKV